MSIRCTLFTASVLGASVAGLSSCTRSGDAANAAAAAYTLTIGAYTTPREAYREILPAFAADWQAKHGETLTFEESYLGSGAQARAITSGFEADIAALSLEPDIETVAQAGLITHDWKSRALGGMVSRSIVVIAVRPGNPKNIKTWDDLRRPGIKVLTPNPRTSGGAMWNVAAIFGAALRGATSAAAGDTAAAEALLRDIVANVAIMDKGARESILTFESGVGDAAITYENEVLVSKTAGKAMDFVVPPGTILIENPVAVVDAYASKRGTEKVAHALVQYLVTPEAQRKYAKHGLRPVDDKIATEFREQYPEVSGLFTIGDLGGWPAVTKTVFAPGGVFERASTRTVAVNCVLGRRARRRSNSLCAAACWCTAPRLSHCRLPRSRRPDWGTASPECGAPCRLPWRRTRCCSRSGPAHSQPSSTPSRGPRRRGFWCASAFPDVAFLRP